MSTLREAAQQALDALYDIDATGVPVGHIDLVIDTLRAALEQQEQEPVAYTGDVARKMREAGMTFHLGMPHAAVMEQMTRFHDLVCAEASIKAAAAFATPPRREWQSLTEEEIKHFAWNGFLMGEGLWNEDTEEDLLAFTRAIEQALKERNA